MKTHARLTELAHSSLGCMGGQFFTRLLQKDTKQLHT